MNVTTLIFLGLAVVWAIVLLPEVVRKVASGRHSDTIRSFNHQLSVLDRSGSGSGASGSNVIDLRAHSGAQQRHRSPASARPVPISVRKRRQEVLTVLGAAAVVTLLCTIAFGGPFLVLHIVADVLLVTYLVLLAQVNRTATESVASPVGSFRTATVGRATPAPRRIAN